MGARSDSGKVVRTDRSEHAVRMARRNNNATGSMFSGTELKGITEIYDRHIERCMVARFESYRDAFREAGREPSAQDFDEILRNSQEARNLQIKHAAKAIQEYTLSRGGGRVTPAPLVIDEQYAAQGSAHAHDGVLNRWKIWKAKTQLKSGAIKVETRRDKRLDGLTSVCDKSEFDSDLASLGSSCNKASPLSLLFMDLDKFKPINDSLGHEAGNRALKAFADVLRRVTGGKGQAYRYGGDEFCVLLPNHSLDEALAVAERIRGEIQEIRTDELTTGLSTSIGVANFPESTSDSTKLVAAADGAMYRSKKAGGKRVSKDESAVGAISNPGAHLVFNGDE
jgi:diguanylate cyclase (GGDEF)-like protein